MSYLLSEVILRLRNSCPIFDGRVSGTQSFVAATSPDSDIDVPCCFVVPMSDTAEARGSLQAQRVTERFATIICADNSKDPRKGRGYAAEVVLRTGRQQLADALMNWAPVTMQNMDDVQYARAQHLFMNEARLWHQYEWTCAYMFASRGDPDLNPNYVAIESKIIAAYFPGFSPEQIKAIMALRASDVKEIATNKASRATVNPADDTTYDVVFSALYGTNPDWIRTKHTPFGSGSTVDHDDVQDGDHRRVDP